MRNLNFNYAGAWNFLPFGPEGIEINFKNYGNIVFIEGINKDAKAIDEEEDYKISSNGTGKSSIQEIIVYALYGKTIKRPEKINIDDVVHNKIGKNCKCIVEFDKYRVVRTRMEGGKKNKNSLRLWESETGEWNDNTEITLGSMVATQKKIDEIIGLTYESFINICIFTDDQRSCFLECDKNTKREIVENLLSLNVYREWYENAKNLKKETKSNIDSKTKEFNMFLNNKEDANKRLLLTKEKKKVWIEQKEKEIKDIEDKIEYLKNNLKASDNGAALIAFKDAQKRIEEINKSLPEIEKEKKTYLERLILVEQKETSLKEDVQIFTDKFKDFSRETKYKLEERTKKQKEIELLESEIPGSRCDRCKSIVDSKNIDEYIKGLRKEFKEIEDSIAQNKLLAKNFEDESSDLKSKQDKIKKIKSATELKIKEFESLASELRIEFTNLSKIKEPKVENNELLIQQKIDSLNSQKESKTTEKEGNTPFDDIIKNDEEDLAKLEKTIKLKEKEIKDLEKEIPYFDYWISGFGETGIRKWIIDGIIPDLNKRVNYWLQFLIDNMITLSFDNELQEKIERNPPDGDPYIYYAMSTGQRRRLNLAVGHSFAYITELSSDAIPNIIFLDEVTTNVDPLGVQGIYNMIRELSETKQVFITTHDQDLIKMLEGSSKIRLIHENGFTQKIQ
jgi:DNA repair exonuclease SbcCD ATPase subunit